MKNISILKCEKIESQGDKILYRTGVALEVPTGWEAVITPLHDIAYKDLEMAPINMAIGCREICVTMDVVGAGTSKRFYSLGDDIAKIEFRRLKRAEEAAECEWQSWTGC